MVSVAASSVLCPPPLLSLSRSSPGARVENYWGKAQVFDLTVGYFQGALELGPVGHTAAGGLGCAFRAGPGEQVGTAWDPHDPALLFTEGRLLHG